MSVFAVDGDLARRVVAVAEVVIASAATLVLTSPVWLFALVGGWQATHVGLWVGALTTLTLGPAAVALLRVVRGVLLRRSSSYRPVRGYLSALALGCSAWRTWLIGAAITLLIGYQLLGTERTSTSVPAAALLAVLCMLAGIAVAAGTAVVGTAASGTGLRYVRAALRSPAVVVVWLMVTPALLLSALIPVAGPTLAFLTPAAWAVVVVVVNATFGFDRTLATAERSAQ